MISFVDQKETFASPRLALRHAAFSKYRSFALTGHYLKTIAPHVLVGACSIHLASNLIGEINLYLLLLFVAFYLVGSIAINLMFSSWFIKAGAYGLSCYIANYSSKVDSLGVILYYNRSQGLLTVTVGCLNSSIKILEVVDDNELSSQIYNNIQSKKFESVFPYGDTRSGDTGLVLTLYK
ncbi:TPA: hypothetical protein I7730_15745 [Vibrio vulnificus]|uniref:Uncharacterized protein n=1 Tax=Vibrio vulnificus TaxID=672 RepID=A0A8H9N1S9_VIBVL|nr:hypothetical protein [Vibrio vulnificus]HAS8541235.1 hypothetical protein [Vibrio vulnificus]